MEFNDVYKKVMGFVRMVFCRVRVNWYLFNRRWKEECVEFLFFIIIIVCLLNNFLMKYGEKLFDGEASCVGEEELLVCDEEVNESVGRIRDLFASYFSRVC